MAENVIKKFKNRIEVFLKENVISLIKLRELSLVEAGVQGTRLQILYKASKTLLSHASKQVYSSFYSESFSAKEVNNRFVRLVIIVKNVLNLLLTAVYHLFRLVTEFSFLALQTLAGQGLAWTHSKKNSANRAVAISAKIGFVFCLFAYLLFKAAYSVGCLITSPLESLKKLNLVSGKFVKTILLGLTFIAIILLVIYFWPVAIPLMLTCIAFLFPGAAAFIANIGASIITFAMPAIKLLGLSVVIACKTLFGLQIANSTVAIGTVILQTATMFAIAFAKQALSFAFGRLRNNFIEDDISSTNVTPAANIIFFNTPIPIPIMQKRSKPASFPVGSLPDSFESSSTLGSGIKEDLSPPMQQQPPPVQTAADYLNFSNSQTGIALPKIYEFNPPTQNYVTKASPSSEVQTENSVGSAIIYANYNNEASHAQSEATNSYQKITSQITNAPTSQTLVSSEIPKEDLSSFAILCYSGSNSSNLKSQAQSPTSVPNSQAKKNSLKKMHTPKIPVLHKNQSWSNGLGSESPEAQIKNSKSIQISGDTSSSSENGSSAKSDLKITNKRSNFLQVRHSPSKPPTETPITPDKITVGFEIKV